MTQVLAAVAPAALLLGAVTWAQRPGRTGVLRRAALELRLLRLPALTLWAAPPLLSLLQPRLGGLALAVAAPLLLAAGLGAALEPGRLGAWLTQPLPRWRLLAEKLSVAALLVLGALLQGWAVHPGEGMPVATLSCVLGLGLAPALVLATRQPVFAGLLTAGCAGALQHVLEATLGQPGGVSLLASVGVAAGVSGVALWAALARLGTLGAAAPAALGPWEAASRGAAWRGPALRVWLRKELRLQLGTALVAGALVVGWGVTVVLPSTRPAVLEVLGFGGLALGLLAGLTPLAAERRFGTAGLDLLALPQAVAWRARVGVTLATALACGVVLPLALAAGADVLSRALGGPSLAPASARGPVAWAGAVLLCSAVGLAVSARVQGLTRAFLVACGALVGLGAWLLAAVVFGAGLGWRAVASGALGSAALALTPSLARVLQVSLLLALLGVVAALALAAARRAWLPTTLRGPRPGWALALMAVVVTAFAGVGAGALGVLAEALARRG